ncbi:MAG: hypothetical protein NTW04_06405, partial [Elusimicrobia bacterium]|nr:hypothetical protein [Elusimicrobiota bacterium]
GIIMSDTDIIDAPTAGAVDYYGLQIKSRFFSAGGVMTGLAFGITSRLNLGTSVQIEHLIGTASPIRLIRPEIQAKFRFYDGTQYVPAFALGYDGQGYYYDRADKKYMQKSRGLYLVGSKEVFTPSFQIHPGINVSDFDSDYIFFFLGANFTVEDSFALLFEWDNIQRIKDSRVNGGIRFYVTPSFQIDFAVRGIGKNSRFDNGGEYKSERVVQLRYQTNF